MSNIYHTNDKCNGEALGFMMWFIIHSFDLTLPSRSLFALTDLIRLKGSSRLKVVCQVATALSNGCLVVRIKWEKGVNAHLSSR